MTLLRDGTVLQGGVRFAPRGDNPGDTVREINFPVTGQITKAIAADDPKENLNGETWLCDIHVTELGIDLFAVPWTAEKSGPDNYVYVAPMPATKNLDGTPFSASLLKPAVSDGDTVVVVFAFGMVHRPYIIKVIPHNIGAAAGKVKSPSPRPGKADGDCYKVRFNGTNFFMDKDGNVSFKSTDTLDKSIPGKNKKKFSVEFDGMKLLVDREADKFDFLCDNGDEVSISKTDGVQISTPAGGGTSASFKGGNVEIEAGNGKKVTIGFKGAGTGKFAVTNATGELIDQLEKLAGGFVDNAAALVAVSGSTGSLNPTLASLLGSIRFFFQSLKV